MLKTILTIIIIAASYPTAIILGKLTKDEKNIYMKKRYFPTLLWIFAILAAISYILKLNITALTLTFMFLVLFFWRGK